MLCLLYFRVSNGALFGQVQLYFSHYDDVMVGAIASQITSLTIVYSTVYSDADQRKHQSSASLAFVRRIHRRPVNSLHKWPVTRKMFSFDDVIMYSWYLYAFYYIPIDGSIANAANDKTVSNKYAYLALLKRVAQKDDIITTPWFLDNEMPANQNKFQRMLLGHKGPMSGFSITVRTILNSTGCCKLLR